MKGKRAKRKMIDLLGQEISTFKKGKSGDIHLKKPEKKKKQQGY